MELYRPMSAEEYEKLAARNFTGFPPCRDDQQLFTLLLSQQGAAAIARRMRIAKHSEPTVYVVSVTAEDSYIRQYPVQHKEDPDRSAVWIPAEELDQLNQHLLGKIRVIEQFNVDHADGDIFFV